MFGILGTLSILTIAMACPVAPEEAQAADAPVSAGGSALSVSVSNGTVALEADPTVNNGIALKSVTVSAKTTNGTGYTMKLNAKSDTALKATDSSNTTTVPTLAANTVLTSFPANRWGYYFGATAGTTSTTYKPISTTATVVDSTTVANSTSRTRTLTIVAKINNTLPAGTYSTQLVVSVVGNAPSISEIQYMQEMTSDICATTKEGSESQLEDKRDGNKYWVGKMLDNRCWMLQNLALGSTGENTVLTPTDSNIASEWRMDMANNQIVPGQTDAGLGMNGVWNFGEWVLATPLLTTSCGTSSSSVSDCVRYGFVNVSNTTNFQPTYTASIGTWNGATVANNTLVAVNCTKWAMGGC